MMKYRCSWLIGKLIWRHKDLGRICEVSQKLRSSVAIYKQNARLCFSYASTNELKMKQQPKRHCHTYSRELFQQDAVKGYMKRLKEEYREACNQLNCASLCEEDRKILSARHVELTPLAALLEEMDLAEKDFLELESMYNSLNTIDDRELMMLVNEEQKALSKNIADLQRNLVQALVEREEHNDKDVILEVTSGRTTGGDICQQFTKEIFDMYRHYADYKDWSFEVLNYMPADYGGLHHASACISGENVYKCLKYEGGTHRVQRIPEVGLSSRMQRIHTGTMAVIVLPQFDEVDIKIQPDDLRIDTFRAKGAGGQHVNTTESAVRIVHIPTGLTVECQQQRSQLRNREIAMRALKAKLYHQVTERETEQRQSTRKLQVGTRTQSERIRSYNFSQDRITDHRINYVMHDIKEFLLSGRQLDELISNLLEAAEQEALLQLVERTKSAEEKLK
uniref:Mitochondrial translation release factor 1 n=1 Tax=Callorhinchus milii TaxID=7868 RepID=A0A4W3H7Y6_CALMI|eukprot:gi/632977470/ref/XP_007905363.1/ PREDICTED: peptide chain release factor 1, mitochondrial isoform X1 [Callorhinchus milii]